MERMKKMTGFNVRIVLAVLFALLFSSTAFSSTFNAGGDFSVNIESQRDDVFNDDIEGDFVFTITNNEDRSQKFEISIKEVSGWDLELSDESFTLAQGESIDVTLNYAANSNFDYNTDLVSPDEIKISQNNDYIGNFEFPLTISGGSEDVAVSFQVLIRDRQESDYVFNPQFAPGAISPVSPLGFTITAENLDRERDVSIRVEIGSHTLREFEDTFSPSLNYKVYQTPVSSSFGPGTYEARITIRLTEEETQRALEWFETQTFEVEEYSNIVEAFEERDSFFEDEYVITVSNNGNVDDVYEKSVDFSFLKGLLFSASEDYEKTAQGAKFNIELESGETKTITYSFNYLSLYIIFALLAVLLGYLYVRKASNPLDVETEIYEVKKDVHEGVKSMKVKIGFENIKESEIDALKVIFRMPSYLQVKENSFLLTEPNHVLKGKNQFKLEWDFKRFEKNDSRIIGFQLVNRKGVLGDIRLSDLEVEVKVNGKVKRYYTPFETIRG